MKLFFKIFASFIMVFLLSAATSCVVLVPAQQHDNGKHKGWYKKPHHQYTPKEKAPGKHKSSNGKHKKK